VLRLYYRALLDGRAEAALSRREDTQKRVLILPSTQIGMARGAGLGVVYRQLVPADGSAAALANLGLPTLPDAGFSAGAGIGGLLLQRRRACSAVKR
jgi:hypothetical protein